MAGWSFGESKTSAFRTTNEECKGECWKRVSVELLVVSAPSSMLPCSYSLSLDVPVPGSVLVSRKPQHQ